MSAPAGRHGSSARRRAAQRRGFVTLWLLICALIAVDVAVVWQQRATAPPATDTAAAAAPAPAPAPAPHTTAQAHPVAWQARRASRTTRAEPAETAEPPAAPEAPQPEAPGNLLAAAPSGLEPFAGLGTWIDVYDTASSPAEQVRWAVAGGVETIFVQSARHASPDDIRHPERLARTIELAHDHGLAVVTWYIPDFTDLERDLRRAQAGAAFTTPRGDRPDAFGLDIELEDVDDAAERTRRLLWLSERLREWAGPDYPLAAIVLPPLQLDLRPGWWPDFPYAALTEHYDVFVPMSYSSYRGTDADTTYRWNLGNITELRRRAGAPQLPMHLAGGIADDLTELDAFVEAAHDGAVLGASLYDLHTTPAETWPTLRRLRTDGGPASAQSTAARP